MASVEILKTEIFEESRFHRWDLSPQEAIRTQKELRLRLLLTPLADANIRLVAGVDVGLPRSAKIARAAIAVLDYATMELIEQSTAEMPVPFPYLPGLLSFREMPVILAALAGLQSSPDVFIVDGHGYAHPRRFGLACHLGVWLDQPAIGCGKSILTGETGALAGPRGSITPLRDGEETIGLAIRTRENVKPVYISIGHRIDLESAARIVLNCGRGLRLPEPIRWAHRLASAKKVG
ncbi:MAG TPA: deoxyribonuclease V [Chloroflexi bacterium]|nr:deoxyribonuclease V [Chloroflexota bacterium]HBY07994.1 deoxyribonuclease V [Chloroflexota bacterium]